MIMHFFLFFQLFFIYVFASFSQIFSTDIEVTSRILDIGNPPVSLNLGGYFISVWSLHSSDEADYGIFGQIYDPKSSQYSDSFKISTSTNYSQGHPSVSLLNDGTSLVVWESQNQDGDGLGIYGQFLLMDQKIGITEFKVNNITAGDQKSPTVASSNGYFVVSWQGPDSSNDGIYAKIYDSKGEEVYPDFLANQNQANEQSTPSVGIKQKFDTDLITNLYIVITWMGFGQPSDVDYGIYAREMNITLDSNLTSSFGNEFLVNQETNNNQTYPKIALTTTGSVYLFVIVWQGDQVKARICSSFGQRNAEIIVNTRQNLAPDLGFFPSVGIASLYGIVVSYHMKTLDSVDLDVYSQLLTLSGDKDGDEIRINIYQIGNQKNPFTCINSYGNLLYLWETLNFNSAGNTLDFQSYEVETNAKSIKTLLPNGDQINLSDFNVSKVNPFICKVNTDLSYNYVLFKDENIKINVYDMVTKQFISNYEWENSSNFSSFDIGFGSDKDYIIVWCENDTIFAKSSFFTGFLQINKNYPGQNPKVFGFYDNSFIIIWTCLSSQKNSSAICCRIYDSYLNSSQEIFISNDLNTTNQSMNNASIQSYDQQLILIVWVSNTDLTTIQGIYINIDIDNLAVSYVAPIFEIYQNATFQTNPKTALNSNNFAFIVWEELLFEGLELTFRGQIIDNKGNKITPLIVVSTFTDLNQINPSVDSYISDFIVVWQGFGQDTDGFGIFAQYLDTLGNKYNYSFQVNSMINGDQLYPVVIGMPDEDLMDFFWINSDDLSLSYIGKIPTEITSNPDGRTTFTQSGFLGNVSLPTFGDKVDALCSVFSKLGDYFFLGLATGDVQIYEFAVLLKRNEISLTNESIAQLNIYNDLLLVLPSSLTTVFIVNVSDIYNPIISSYSFETNCPNINSTSNYQSFLLDIYDDRLYIILNEILCIYNLTIQENSTLPLLRQYQFEFGTPNSTFLHDYLLLCALINGTTFTLDTENLTNIKVIETNNLDNDIINFFWTPDGNYLFVSRPYFLEIYLNVNLTFSSISQVYEFQSPHSFFISNDYQLLGFIIPNGQMPKLYILDISTELYVGSSIAIEYVPDSYLFQSSFHPNNSYILLCESQTLEMILIAKADQNNITPNLQVVRNDNYYHNFTNWWIDISPSESTIYMMSQSNEIVNINISDFNSGNINNQFPPIEPSFFLYPYNSSISDEKIMIYEVINETIFIYQSEIPLNGINDYVLMTDKNFMFVGLYDKLATANTTIISIDVTAKKQPKILKTLDLGVIGLPYLALSKNETELFVSIDLFGVIIFNVSNKSEPTILNKLPNTSNRNYTILISAYQDGNDYLIVSNLNKAQFFTLKVNYDDFSLTKVGVALTSQEIIGLTIFKGTFLVVQIANYSTLLFSIYDITNPKLMQTISLTAATFQIRSINIVISTVINACFFPFGNQAVTFFSTGNNDIYPVVYLSPNPLNIEFTIKFLNYNFGSNINTKVLDFSISNENLNWIFVNENDFSLTFNPSTAQDIMNYFQPLTVIYSTNLNSQELTNNEINALISTGYLDGNLFITQSTDISSVPVFDPTISENRISFLFSQHYFIKSFFFSVDYFQTSVALPVLNMNVSYQLSLLGYDVFIAEDMIDFTLSSDTFINPYDGDLNYTAENLPNWLSFDSKTLRFFGFPPMTEINKDYNINLIASNGFQEITDQFPINIRYFQPFLNKALQGQMTSSPQSQSETDFMFSKDSFLDPNNGTLIYKVTLINNFLLPSWILFDESNLAIKMTPTNTEIFQSFTLNVTASNKKFSVSDSFRFEVSPSLTYILQLISQILAGIVAIIGYYRYKSDVYNQFFKKYYEFPITKIKEEEFYEQEIYFIEDELKKTGIIWNIMKKDPKAKIFNEKNLLMLDFNEILSNNIKTACDKAILEKKLNGIEDFLLEPKGTIFVICEAFLNHHLMKNNAELEKAYDLIKSKRNSKCWYYEFVKFSSEPRDYAINKFKEPILDYERIKTLLNENSQMEKLAENPSTFHLVCGMIRADALGIPEGPKKWYQRLEISRAESCFVNVLDITEINAKLVAKGKKIQQADVEKNRKLPLWLNYQIKSGILIFNGKPDHYDIGVYNIQLIDRSNFIVRAFSIEVMAYPRPKTMIEIKRTLTDVEEVKWELTDENINKNQVK